MPDRGAPILIIAIIPTLVFIKGAEEKGENLSTLWGELAT